MRLLGMDFEIFLRISKEFGSTFPVNGSLQPVRKAGRREATKHKQPQNTDGPFRFFSHPQNP